jgi:Putative beta-barrel porin-2, OmpL-like. bbp2
MIRFATNFGREMKLFLLAMLLLYSTFLVAQNDSTKKWTFSGYGEIYYSYDFANPANHQKENFIYNHKRHNELNANLIVVKATYTDKIIRTNLGLMVGNYAQYNLSAEPTWAQFVYEANIGVKLSKKHNLWLDAGIMPSHIGFESAISADCWTLTRSILAENSPYFETGLKMSYTNNKENLTLALLVLNGWQRIQKPADIQKPSVGVQVNYKPTEKLILNYSNFIGTDKPDSLKAVRTFHNFYAQYEPTKKVGLIIGFDIGNDKYNTTDYGVWLSPVLILRYTLNTKLKMALRGEYYKDKDQILISTNSVNGFQVSGVSANVDYAINKRVLCRVEGKMYDSKDPIFKNNKNNNYSLTTNMTIKF